MNHDGFPQRYAGYWNQCKLTGDVHRMFGFFICMLNPMMNFAQKRPVHPNGSPRASLCVHVNVLGLYEWFLFRCWWIWRDSGRGEPFVCLYFPVTKVGWIPWNRTRRILITWHRSAIWYGWRSEIFWPRLEVSQDLRKVSWTYLGTTAHVLQPYAREHFSEPRKLVTGHPGG